MKKSTNALATLLAGLSAAARGRGLNDTAWSKAAGLRKETLSRLRGRDSCDFATLQALAVVVGASLEVVAGSAPPPRAERLFPDRLLRDDEQRLLELARSQALDLAVWLAAGPRFFMAGLAVLLASLPGHDRSALLALAEALHPGSTEPVVMARWLAATPLQPSRFVSMLQAESRHAA